MPPLRNIPLVKPMKTERTHEENQERAYIAASRRSDRSLEARVESARRASEIHKRRTGRSLRVTEQDVMNEEMYEEEDDDLPLQYRRLSANLDTGTHDFNRKLAAYLTHNVLIRNALNEAFNTSFAQQYPGAQQFPTGQNPMNPMYPSPLITGNLTGMPMAQSPQATPTSPHPYRQTPYPMPGAAGFRGQVPHKRASSSAVPYHVPGTQSYNNTPVDTQPPSNFRRMSMPAATSVKPEVKAENSPYSANSAVSSPGAHPKKEGDVEDRPKTTSMGPPKASQSLFDLQQPSALLPLTTTLTPDTQQLIGASLPPNDPLISNIMYGGNPSNNYFGMNNFMGNGFYQDGMNSTLAPNASSVYSNMHDSNLGNSADTMHLGQMATNLGDIKGVHYAGNPTSGLNTPGESFYDDWVDTEWAGDTT